MRTTKRVVQVAGLAAGVAGAIATSTPQTAVGRAARRLARRITRDMRYVASSAPGILYRLAGRHPDPNVSDDILADRIRSSIGPLEKRLDLPRIHVAVEDKVAVLHGEVPAETDARAVEHAIMGVSGVRGIESHLHAGLIAGDTRPSQGVTAPTHRSPALQTLLEAARDAGARRPYAAVHAVLCGFSDRVPVDEREQMLAHLPLDVRVLAGPARRHGERTPPVRTLEQLLAAAPVEGDIEAARATAITVAIVRTLRDLVRDETADLAAVLPPELRQLWEAEPAR